MRSTDKTPFALKFIRWFFPKLEVVNQSWANSYFVRVFTTPLRYKLPSKEKQFLASAEKFSLQFQGKHVQGYKWGKGQPVLVVHGWAGRATQFRKFIPALNEAGYQVIAFDGPAHGLSEGKTINIIGFSEVMKILFKEIGVPVAVIAHSFGGVATVYSISQGLPVTKLINIASPSIGDEVINTYLRAIGGRPATGEAFKKYMFKTYGKTFDEFSLLHLIHQLPAPISLMIVQDEDDKEVVIKHATELKKEYPAARLLVTSGLGHTRVLRDSHVISEVIKFIQADAS